MEEKKFLTTVFSDIPKGILFYLWEKHPTKKITSWFSKVDDAVSVIRKCNGHDIYVGCGLMDKSGKPYQRCKAHEVVGIPGLWLDVDIMDPAHKKANLPEDFRQVETIVGRFPFRPSIVVHSGHGYQFWWLFEKPWMFNGDEDRDAAALLSQRFTRSMRDSARIDGFDLDMTFDLSRVFRIPGTMNCKREPFVKISIMDMTNSRIRVEDVQKWKFDEAPQPDEPVVPRVSISPHSSVPFRLNSQANPPQNKLDVLLEVEPRFKLSWDKNRKDFKDDSPSSYDYSLATFAIQAEWTFQEVVDLIIAFRRRHGLDLKLREDYYYRTIMNATQTSKKLQSIDTVEEITARLHTAKNMNKQEAAPLIRNAVSELIGVNVSRIIKYRLNPPEYRLETPKGCINLGAIQNLIEQNLLRRKVADATGHLMSPIEKNKWPKVAQALLDACDDEDAGEENTDRGTVRNWITLYLQHHSPMYDKNQAFIANKPFFMGDKFYFFGIELRQFLGIYCRELITARNMGMLLKQYGFQSESMHFEKDSKYVNRTVWTISCEDETVMQFRNDDLLNQAIQSQIR